MTCFKLLNLGTRSLLIAAGMLLGLRAEFAEAEYAWAVRSGGDPVGRYADGVAANFNWSWNPGDQAITGTVEIQRRNAGVYFVTSETHEQTVLQSGFSAPEYNNSPFSVSVGGVKGISHFLVEGEGPRAVNDVPAGTISTSVLKFLFTEGFASLRNTLIALFDPGAAEGSFSGPFTYDFDATLGGQPVDISSWAFSIEDPYLPAGNAPTGFTYNSSTGVLTLSSYFGGNFPQNLVFLDTKNTTFDTLTLTANGLALDIFSVGFGANTPAQAVPEPGSMALLLSGGVIVALRLRRSGRIFGGTQ